MITCKNCGKEFEGNYCPGCGQSAAVDRITVKYLIHDFLKIFFNFKSGKLFLLRKLFTHPGTVVREYIGGKRKKYLNPIQFYIGATALTIYLILKLDIQGILIEDLHESAQVSERYGQFMALMFKYYNAVEFAILPVFSMYTYIFFRKSGYNYSEIFILNTYCSAQRLTIYVVFIFLIYLFPGYSALINNISIAVLTLFTVWFYLDFFKPVKKTWTIIKILIVALLYYSTLMIILIGIYSIFFDH